jgi:hypothetical protein
MIELELIKLQNEENKPASSYREQTGSKAKVDPSRVNNLASAVNFLYKKSIVR